MALFILETDHPSGRIIRLTDHPSKYKQETNYPHKIHIDERDKLVNSEAQQQTSMAENSNSKWRQKCNW